MILQYFIETPDENHENFKKS